MSTLAEAAPAGGAATSQVIGVTLAAAVLTAALLWYGHGHRTGRSRALGRAAEFCERMSGFPGWAAFPAALATAALGIAGLGLYWDVAIHIAQGRDEGPLANPSHYAILLGLFGIFAAGWAAIVLPRERPGPAAVRITSDWYAPVGGVLLAAAATFALIGFPLDDMWHRLFGQDVTLWGPTHVMLIGGGALTIPAIVLLLAEGRSAQRATRAGALEPRPRLPRTRLASLWATGLTLFIALSTGGGLLAGVAAFQGEFDFGVPQYNLLFHPLTLAVGSGLALVAARLMVGRGGAIGAVLFFLGVRELLRLIVGPGLGEIVPSTPLYLVEALVVEAAALVALRSGGPYRLALIAGPAIGVIGTLAEYAWADVAMPIAWPAHMLPEAILVSIPAATGAAVVGAFFAGALSPASSVGTGRRAWLAPALGLLAIAATGAALLPTSTPPDASALMTLDPVATGPKPTANVTVRLSPRDAADDAYWIQGLAWQGGQHEIVTGSLERVGPGVYRTTKPLPTYGTWKSVIRVHRGRNRMSVPVYLPADPAIPVPGVPAAARARRTFESDIKLLQRERKLDTAPWLWPLASSAVGLLMAGILALQGWALMRIARSRETDGRDLRRPPAAPAAAPGRASRAEPPARRARGMSAPDHDVLIVGSGLAGVGMGIRLERDGRRDFLLIEQEDAIGGTWRDNHYPGCACDVASPLYSFSFAPNPDWSRLYAGHAEIRAYVESCADEAGIRDRIRTGAQLTAAEWDEEARLWRAQVNGREEITARVIVSALGGLTRPSIPEIDGLGSFTGDLFHSARWNHDVDLTGKRVAVVGTGASAIQLVPRIARRAAHVDVYQRTPPWVIPKVDRGFSRAERALFRRLPVTQRALRGAIYAIHEAVAVGNTVEPRLHVPLEMLGRAHIRRQIRDPELRRQVTPDYRIGCKRILISNSWYRALDSDHVDLLTGGIDRVTPDGVVGSDGAERPVDALVLATGFRPTDLLTPLTMHGRDGRDVNDAWRDGIHAHLGTTVAGFPNMFILTGPNTGTGHNSQLYMIESQYEYVLGALRAMESEGLDSLDVRPEAESAFNERVQRRMERTVWLRGGCSSWYLDAQGRNVTLWPSFTFSYRSATAQFDRDSYTATKAPARAPVPQGATA